jgi:hypothetical protein
LGTEANPIVIEDDSAPLGSETNPIVIHVEEDHSYSEVERLSSDNTSDTEIEKIQLFVVAASHLPAA